MDAGQTWDELVASSLQRASTATSAKRLGRCPLRVRKEPLRYWLPHKDRDIAQIDPDLRLAIRRLIAGDLPWPFVLLGPAGVGKSCAALCLLDVVGGWYFTVAELCEEFIHAQQRMIDLTTRRLWERLEQTSLVVVDELGARERVSDHHYETVKRLLDKRENRPLVCISNHSLERLAQLYDDRLASRLAYGTVLTVSAEDRRLKKGGSPR